MSDPWFFHPRLQLGRVTLEPDEAHHARNVRRLQPGDALTLFDGRGGIARGVLAGEGSGTARRKDAIVDIAQIESQPPESAPLTIIAAGCKGERQGWMVEKLTELGAASLEFATFERSVVNIQAGVLAKLQRASREACKQCRRAFDLRIATGASLAEATRAWIGANPRGRLLYGDAAVGRGEAHAAPGRDAVPIAIVIGPEGGLTANETTFLSQSGAAPVRIGRNILRIETAAIACAAVWAAQHATA